MGRLDCKFWSAKLRPVITFPEHDRLDIEAGIPLDEEIVAKSHDGVSRSVGTW